MFNIIYSYLLYRISALVSNTSKVSSIIFSTFAKERFDVAVAAQSRVAPGWDGRRDGRRRARSPSLFQADGGGCAAADGQACFVRFWADVAVLGQQ